MQAPPLLSVKAISLQFRGVTALKEVSFEITPGEVVGLIGPNGAGKTSLFNCLSGIYTPTSGDILFNSVLILRKRPYQIAKLGIGRTFQNLALFPHLSVLENVLVGCHVLSNRDFIQGISKWPWLSKEENVLRNKAMNLITILNLDLYWNRPASGLSYGILKRIELARALASNPKLLLLDEPASGLSQAEVAELKDLIRRLQAHYRVTQLLVEHNTSFVMDVCDRIIVLNAGNKIADDLPERIRDNKEVIRAYFGEKINECNS